MLRLPTTALILVVALAVLSTSPVCAADKTITDPAQSGPDFQVQGEYVGESQDPTLSGKLGAQVLAMGDGKFQLIVYHGGLPGNGWKRGDRTEKTKGQSKGGRTHFTVDGRSAILRNGTLTLKDADGKAQAELQKKERKSRTLGAKPPEGAIVLFDGTTAENFRHGKLVSENLLLNDCESIQKFGDHTLHLEFRTPFKPTARGQKRGNSGVYVQSRYEVQILDTFALEGKDNECGGIYSIKAPDVNMCYPPLAWQTYDIDFTAARYGTDEKKTKNARITVRHNGVVIHDDVELPKGTPGKLPEGASPEGVYLQGHGNPVYYRNIWVVRSE